MTLMVPGSFSIGSTNQDTMSKSLDDMIKDRRKEQQQASKKGVKKVATSDRNVATGRAKRAAAVKARRGLSQTNAPNRMEVEREVYRQSRKSTAAKERGEKKATQGRMPANSSTRRTSGRKKGNDAKAPGTAPAFGGRTPPKKAVNAAVQAMEGAGFKVPDGMQVVIALAPAAVANPPATNNTKNTGNNSGKGGPGGKQKGAGRRRN